MSTKNGSASREDDNKIPFVIISRGENERHARARRTGILLDRTRRRPFSSCFFAEITGSARKDDER